MWIPTSEEELAEAAEAGTLVEGASLEFKREMENGAGANKELARDLASLAISGGTLIVGILDEKDRDPANPTSALQPTPLGRLAERVEQIALTRCEPPLTVITREIASTTRTGNGYLVVHVPPSAVAPHMVDGRYWGRGERTKRQLGNADVVALHDQRRVLNRDAEEDLNAYIARDPYTEAGRTQELAHLFFVAVPRPGRPGMLYSALDSSESQRTQLYRLLNNRQHEYPGAWSPDFGNASEWSNRGDGWAASSYGLAAGRALTEDAREKGLIEIEMTEDGAVRMLCGRGSDVYQPDSGLQVVIEAVVAGLTNRAVRLTGDVASKSGYFGEWALGVAMTGLRACESHAVAISRFGSAQPYPDDRYQSLTRASTPEIHNHPGVVTDRLVGRLFRTLGSYSIAQLDPFLGRTVQTD